MGTSVSIDDVFQISTSIRYVALYRNGKLVSQERAGIQAASAAESDRYEELIVNPTLLKLVQQRGDIDCGGAHFVVIRYGNFFELVMPLADGHVSVGLELSSDPVKVADAVRDLFA